MATCLKKPRLTCSNENQNYVTLDKLLKEVAEPVVRKRFDIQFHPAMLQKTLNKESSKINKISQINRKRNILFPPRDQKPVCSSDFDLTLMILLIRNLTQIQISDILPLPSDTLQGADLSRIKFYRNELAHCNGKISDIAFEQQWVEICQAIVRLGGESYKEICAQLRVSSLSSGKGYGMKNIHQEIIEDWKEIEIKMVETNAIKELMKVTKENSFIAVIGPSGCGKSTAAHQVSLLLHRNEGYQIIPSNFPEDITHYYNESEKQVFIFDDVCGKYSLDYDLLKKWKKLGTELNKIKQCEHVIILASSRSDIFYQFKDVQFLFTTHFDMLSKDYSLCENERFLMAKAHVGAENAEILQKANLFNRYDFFPLLCQIFATNQERNILKFFSQPVKVIKEELTLMKEEKDQTSFAVFSLFVIHNNCITDEVLSATSGIKTILSDIAEECVMSTQLNIKVVRTHLDIFLHSYVKKIGSSYMIMHDKLFDIFVSFYGEHLLDIILNHCSYPVLFTRFQLQSVEDTDEYMIKIPVEKEAKYFQRLFHPSDLGDFANIFWHTHLKSRTFHQQLLKLLSEDPVCRDLCRSLSDTESSPLLITAARGYNDIIKVLLDMEMNVNVCDDFELTPLAYAAGGGCLESIKLLLENNGDINKRFNHKHSSDFAIVQFFAVLQNISTATSLDIESLKNFTESFKKMPKNDLGLSGGAYWGTPLYLSTAFGHTEIVKLLLKQNCDIDPHDCLNLKPLYVATLCNHIEIVRILLEHGCDINICNEENESPLFVASNWGHVDIVKLLLLDKNCDINICNKKRESPLHAASKCMGCFEVHEYKQPGSLEKIFEIWLRISYHKKIEVSTDDYGEIVKALLMRNADVNICNTDNKTPMDVALENEHAEIVKLFSEH
ncbi:uncharacterized protein LOC143083902 [Mytilus galloprovincialis]|uniref:uncharacterized protein LOC143083902 n=1 Tax=Mytilus galloprovincialis TaxID=29158 RepID=UPI003F7C41CC